MMLDLIDWLWLLFGCTVVPHLLWKVIKDEVK